MMFAGSEVTYQRKSLSPEKKNSIDPMNFCANEDGQTVLCKTRKIIPNNINHQNSTALWGFEEITQTLPFESESPTYGTTSLWGTSECSVVPRGTKRTTIWGTFDSNKAEIKPKEAPPLVTPFATANDVLPAQRFARRRPENRNYKGTHEMCK